MGNRRIGLRGSLVSICTVLILAAILLSQACAQPAATPIPTQPTATTPGQAPAATTSAPAPAITTTQAAAQTQTVVWRAITQLPSNGDITNWMPKLCDRVAQKTGGAFTIKYLGGPEVVPGANQSQAIKNGVVDIAMHEMPELVPAADLWQLSTLTLAQEKSGGFMDLMQAEYQKAGLKYLWRVPTVDGFFMYMQFKVEKPEDFAGKKMRVAPTCVALYKALNVVGISIPLSDQYAALERGLVQGKFGKMASTIDAHEYEVLKYWVDHSMYDGGGEPIVMSMDKWNGLTPAFQKALTDSADELQTEAITFFTAKKDLYKQTLIKNKMQPITFSADDAARFIKIGYDAQWSVEDKNLPKDLVTKAKALLGTK